MTSRSAHSNGACDWPCPHCTAEDADADARAQSRYEASLDLRDDDDDEAAS